jgi:hypothetical protein
MDRLSALTRSDIALPGSEADAPVGLLPIALDAIEDTIDELISLIDDALALMEDQQ